jgi:hypothetical protein
VGGDCAEEPEEDLPLVNEEALDLRTRVALVIVALDLEGDGETEEEEGNVDAEGEGEDGVADDEFVKASVVEGYALLPTERRWNSLLERETGGCFVECGLGSTDAKKLLERLRGGAPPVFGLTWARKGELMGLSCLSSPLATFCSSIFGFF